MKTLDSSIGKARGAYKGMKCPHCSSTEGSRVIDVRDLADGRRRRHVCDRCEGRFTTYEITAEQFERLQRVKVNEAQVERAITALKVIRIQLGASNGLPSKN